MFGSSKARRDAEFTAFVGEASPGLMRTAYALTGSPDAAHELVQATLVKTYAAWPRITGSPVAYARRIMANQRVDSWRATRHEHLTDSPPEGLAPPGDDVAERDAVLRMVAQLPEQQRKVVVLRYWNDLPEREVAEILGISVGAVKSAASRGLATLRSRHTALEGQSS